MKFIVGLATGIVLGAAGAVAYSVKSGQDLREVVPERALRHREGRPRRPRRTLRERLRRAAGPDGGADQPGQGVHRQPPSTTPTRPSTRPAPRPAARRPSARATASPTPPTRPPAASAVRRWQPAIGHRRHRRRRRDRCGEAVDSGDVPWSRTPPRAVRPPSASHRAHRRRAGRERHRASCSQAGRPGTTPGAPTAPDRTHRPPGGAHAHRTGTIAPPGAERPVDAVVAPRPRRFWCTPSLTCECPRSIPESDAPHADPHRPCASPGRRLRRARCRRGARWQRQGDADRHARGPVDRVAAGVEGPRALRPPHEHRRRTPRVRRRRPVRSGRRAGSRSRASGSGSRSTSPARSRAAA